MKPRNLIPMIVMGAVAISMVPSAEAGKFKSKMQQRLSEPSNIQYEPYYLQTEYDIQRGETEELRAPRRDMPAAQSTTLKDVNKVGAGAQIADGRIAGFKEEARSKVATMFNPYVIYNVNYHSQLEDNVVTVKGKVVFEVFQDGRTQLPLVNSNVGLIDVQVNKGGSFVMSHGGKYYLIMNKKGRYTLDIEFLIKAKREREHGPGSFSVDVMAAPISQFEFAMPEKGVQIFIEPAIKVEQDDEEGKTTAWAVMPNTSNVSVRWTKALPKEEIETVEMEPKIYAETSTHASLGGGVIRSQSYINYSILQSEVSSFRVALPTDVSVLNVSGGDMRDWKVSTKDGVQYLDVFLNFGRKGNYALNVSYEKIIPEGTGISQLPWIRPTGVERETGYYGVAASTNVELAVKNADKVTRIDIKQLPQNIWQSSSNPILLAFKYLKHPHNIEIALTRHEELPVLVAAIDRADHVTLHTEEGKILTKVTYQLRNNVKQFLRLKFPAEAEIWSSFVSGKPVKPARDKEGNILIPLEKSQLNGQNLRQFPVEIVYLDKGKKLGFSGKLNFNLPSTDIPISQVYWSVYLPYDFTYFNFDGDLREAGGRSSSFLARGVQGRLRQAADDIGDQFSPGNTSQTQRAGGGFQSFAYNSGTVRGVLPIRVNIPQEGQLFQFSKLLMIEGESPKLSVRYTVLLDKVKKPIKLIIFLVIAIWIARKVFQLIRRRKEQDTLPKA